MAKTIKGITIEIGGNTEPLQKSLQDVNRSAADIKSELREVDRLLKLDPSNTTLLAQKQELLGKQIGTTTEKLKRLEDAQEQVNRQFSEGKIGEGQYRAFQRELEKTRGELKKVEDQADETGDEVEEAGEKAEKSGKDAEQGSSKWEKFGTALKGIGSVAGKAFAAVGKAVVGAGTSFLGLAESTRETRTNMAKLETAFTAAGHSADDAKETYTELYGILGDDGQATEAAAHLAQLAGSEKDLSEWAEIATGVYGTFGDSLPIESLTEAANETAKTGQVTGALADALNWADAAGETFGVGLKASNGFVKASKKELEEMTDAQRAEYEARKAQAEEIDKYNKAVEGAASAEDYFNIALANCNTEAEREQLIRETLLKAYSQASDKYKELNQDVIDANLAQAKLNDALAQMGEVAEPVVTSMKKIAASVLEDLVPSVKQIGEGLSGLMNGTEGAADDLAEGFGSLIEMVITKASELLPQFAELAIKMIETIGSTLMEAAPTVLPQAVQVIADLVETMVTTLAQAAPTLVPAVVDLIATIITTILDQLPAILEAVVQLVEGLAEGLINSIPVIVDRLPEIVQGIVDALVEFIPAFIECAIAIVTALVDALPEIIQGLVEALPDIITAIVDGLDDLIPQIIECGITLFTSLVDGIPDAIVSICDSLPQIVEAIATGLIALNTKIVEAGFKLLVSIVKKLPEVIRKVIEAKTKIVDAVIKGFLGAVGKVAEVGFKLFSGLVQKGSEIGSTIKSFVSNLIHSLIDAIRSFISSFVDIGRNLVQGIWEGIRSGWDWLTGKVRDLAHNLLDAAKDALGIHSPSTLFRDQVGKMMAAGIAVGFDQESSKVFGHIRGGLKAEEKKLAASVTNNTSTVNHNTSMGGIVINVTGNVSTPAEARQIGDTIAERVQRGLRYKGVMSLA